MQTRARIAVKGRVQKVGFRTFATEIAWDMGVNGRIGNLDDKRTVEIVCEAEKQKIEKKLKI